MYYYLDMAIIFRLISKAWRYRVRLLLAYSAFFAAVGFSLMVPHLLGEAIDTLVNVHSGGANKQKKQYRKEYPGDNPMAAEDKISEEDLSNSLRNQYESFKKSYQEATKVAEEKGKDHDKDGDVDSKDYLKSKDIAIKKAMKK